MIGRAILARPVVDSVKRRNCRETWNLRLLLPEGGGVEASRVLWVRTPAFKSVRELVFLKCRLKNIYVAFRPHSRFTKSHSLGLGGEYKDGCSSVGCFGVTWWAIILYSEKKRV